MLLLVMLLLLAVLDRLAVSQGRWSRPAGSPVLLLLLLLMVLLDTSAAGSAAAAAAAAAAAGVVPLPAAAAAAASCGVWGLGGRSEGGACWC